MISKKGFHCIFCSKKRKGYYRIIGENTKSCEQCNREYDYIPPKVAVQCPTCRGTGFIK